MNDATGNLLAVRVWGDYACWTRPEMKVERVTYPVMTPTGARGILEAIFWKPEFSWRVHEIDVLKPIRYFSLTRNEVSQRAGPTVPSIDIMQVRTQRHAVVLREVAYVIRAEILLRAHATDDVAKYRDQFRRRIERGACAHRPYLGTREFPAFFGPAAQDESAAAGDLHVGPMIADIDYTGGTGSSVFDADMVAGRVRFPVTEVA